MERLSRNHAKFMVLFISYSIIYESAAITNITSLHIITAV